MASADRRPGSDPPGSLRLGPLVLEDAALLCDLYEIAMAMGYWRDGLRQEATFSCFVRRLPANRGYLLGAGLADVIAALQAFRFSGPALDYLSSLGRFDPEFLGWLAGVRFTGRVRAVPEGTPVFAHEPLLEVTAPIVEAQLVESIVLNRLHYATLIATKAARCVTAAAGRPVIEFGLRRAPGLDAALQAARAAWIGGIGSTSNALAAAWLDIPVTGTMAHSYVMAFPSEAEAFASFARSGPRPCYLVVDTYDTLEGVRRAAALGRQLAREGRALGGVRLDSGDLLVLSREARRILDAAGLPGARIVASGGLDEFEIERLVRAGAPIDAFGVGTRLDTSEDAPVLDMAYKLVRFGGRDVMKLSGGKVTWPGAKQIWRESGADGHVVRDTLTLLEDPAGRGQPLLLPVMHDGAPLEPPEDLHRIRERAGEERSRLPLSVTRLLGPAEFPVVVSPALETRRQDVRSAVR